jgi:hypothetical protein
VLYAALQPGCCSTLLPSPRRIRAALFRRWIELRGVFQRFIKLRWFSQQLSIQFWKLLRERTLIGKFHLVGQSLFPRVSFARLHHGGGASSDRERLHARANPEQRRQHQQEFAASA